MVSNHPEWLVEIINAAVSDLGYEFRAVGNMGSDQQTFAQAGIPASSIGFGGDDLHTSQDLPDKINWESLEKTGRIVALTVLKAMDKPVSGM